MYTCKPGLTGISENLTSIELSPASTLCTYTKWITYNIMLDLRMEVLSNQPFQLCHSIRFHYQEPSPAVIVISLVGFCILFIIAHNA